jgi:hypothetical protein
MRGRRLSDRFRAVPQVREIAYEKRETSISLFSFSRCCTGNAILGRAWPVELTGRETMVADVAGADPTGVGSPTVVFPHTIIHLRYASPPDRDYPVHLPLGTPVSTEKG